AMEGVDAVGAHEVADLAAAADAAEDRDLVVLLPGLAEGHLDRVEDAEVAAAGAPVVVGGFFLPVADVDALAGRAAGGGGRRRGLLCGRDRYGFRHGFRLHG